MWIQEKGSDQVVEYNDSTAKLLGCLEQTPICSEYFSSSISSESQRVRITSKNGVTLEATLTTYSINWNASEASLYQLENIDAPTNNFIAEPDRLLEEIRSMLIAKQTSNLIVFTDLDHRITWVNTVFEKTSEYTLSEIRGQTILSFLTGPESKPGTIDYIKSKWLSGERFRYEILYYSKSGNKFWLDAEEIPFHNDNGDVIGFLSVCQDVSGIKLAICEMISAHEILRTIMDNAPMKVFVKDSRGRFVFYNKSFLDDILNNDYINKRDLSAISLLSDEDKQVLLKGLKIESQQTLMVRNNVHNFLAFKFPLSDARGNRFSIGNIWIDVTDHLHAQRALKESEELYFSTVNSINDAVIAVDMAMQITYLNPSAEKLIGYNLTEVLGKDFHEVVKLREVGRVEDFSEELPQSHSFFDHLVLTSRDGFQIPIGDGSICSIIGSDGEQNGIVMTFKNISDKLQREEMEREVEVRRLTALIEGQEKERSRLAKELHDGLGQMLNLVKMNVDLLTKGKRADISRLISDTIQETARISENLLPSKLRDFDLSTALRSLCHQVGKSTPATIVFHSFGETECMDEKIRINFYRIAQEALNNAIKHSSATSISVDLNYSYDLIRLSIEDNGVGFTGLPEPNEKHFHHGLTNMKERAEIMEGEFFIESKENMGTVIIVEVPKDIKNQPQSDYATKYSNRSR